MTYEEAVAYLTPDPLNNGTILLQAPKLREAIEVIRRRERHFDILVEAMAEVKARNDGKSDQPIADIVKGCIAEILALDAPATANYHETPSAKDHLIPIDIFRHDALDEILIDYDGFGYPAKDGLMDPQTQISPSEIGMIPADATHIVWFNR